METNKILIETKNPEEQFEKHLNLEGNNKIIFSGIFGIGKTYFLKKFFNHPDKYNVVHLFPVNYSIASNEDIFKLIKFDILYEIIVEKEYNIENDYNSIIEKIDLYDIYGFVNHNLGFLLAYLLHFIPNIGKASSNFAEKTKKLWDKYKSKSQESENQEDLLLQISDFVNKTENHYLLENDIIVSIIDEALKNLKQDDNSDNKKENILIIDDLDRVDPEHIFRLLNIFSANTDDDENSKYKRFFFDKVIFVLDIQNVRNIFHSRYGSATDFSGYIDKFYSYEVFDYDNTSAISNNVNEILNTITTSEKYNAVFSFQNDSSDIERLTSVILTSLIKNNALNLRTLLKLSGKEYTISLYQITFKKHVQHQNWQITIFLIFDFLKSIFGSYDGMINALGKCIKDINIDTYRFNLNWYAGMLLVVLDYDKHNFRDNSSNNEFYIYHCEELNLTFQYTIRESHSFRESQYNGNINKVINQQEEEVELGLKIFFHLLHKAFVKINDLQNRIA